MSDKRVKLLFQVWTTNGLYNWHFYGYGIPSEEDYANHERLILMRVPELIGLEEADWDYDYSIRR